MPFSLTSFQQFLRSMQTLLDFVLIWVIIYYVLKIVRNNSRTVQIFKGIVLILVLYTITNLLKLHTLGSLLSFFIQNGFLIVVIIFAPELRAMLERLGKTSMFSAIHGLTGGEKESLVDELVETASILSKEKIGALITLEQGHSLADFIKTGTPINSSVSSELLRSIFVTSTPLHDGAVIIQGGRIACASAYFPPTNQDMDTQYGARHRAAVGISEITDSITIVVSEETGSISVAEHGKLREVDEVGLRDYLNLIIQNTEKEVSQSIGARRSRRISLSKLNVDPLKIERVDASDVVIKKDSSKPKSDSDVSKLKDIFKRKPKKTAVDSEETKVSEDEVNGDE